MKDFQNVTQIESFFIINIGNLYLKSDIENPEN